MWIIFPLVFLGGFVDSIAGGGGLISLTAYLAVGLPAHLALGTNKFSAVPGTGIAAFRFVKNGYVRWTEALFAFAGALIGSALGARIALMVDARIITYLVLVVVPATALFMIFNRGFVTPQRNLSPLSLALCAALVGLVVGAYDGFFGPGTGTLLILAFTHVLGFELLTACGNAKVVNFASNLAAVLTFISSGNINYRLAIPCALCGILGNYAGAGLAMKNGAKIVRPMMLTVITLLLVKIILDLLS